MIGVFDYELPVSEGFSEVVEWLAELVSSNLGFWTNNQACCVLLAIMVSSESWDQIHDLRERGLTQRTDHE